MSLLAAYRRTGADPPWGDAGAAHGVGMEGYYWRIVDPAGGRVVVALCGTCRTGPRRWSVVALALHPGGHLWERVVEHHATDPLAFGVRAADVLDGSEQRLVVTPAPGVALDVSLRVRPGTPHRALGPGHLAPWLPQYWQPQAMVADVSGTLQVEGETLRLDGAQAYLEKNWGRGFAGAWWWGQAFLEPDAGVSFAGGPVAGVGVSAVALRLGGRSVALASPVSLVRVRVGSDGATDTWSLRARSPRWDVTLEGAAPSGAAHVLPVPEVLTGEVHPRSRQHLAGRLALTVSHRGRREYAGESALAGLEHGTPRSVPHSPL